MFRFAFEKIVNIALAVFLLMLPVTGLLAPRATVALFVIASLPLFKLFPAIDLRRALLAGAVIVAVCAYPLAVSQIPYKSIADLSLALLLLLQLKLWLEYVKQYTVSQQLLRLALTLGYIAGIGLIVAEYKLGAPLAHLISQTFERPLQYIFVYDRGIVILAFLLWPLLLCWRANLLVVLCAVAGAVMLARYTSSQASLFSLLLGLSVYVLAVARVSVARILVAALFIAALLFMPVAIVLLQQIIGPDNDIWPAANSASRMKIWVSAAQAIMHNPWLGYGMEGARTVPGIRDHVHPHNGILQIWMEFGLIGILACCTVFYKLMCQIKLNPTALAVMTAWLGVFCVSYNIWQPWWLAMPVMLAVVLLFAQRPQAATASGV